MDLTRWFDPDHVYLATFVVSFINGFVPIVNTEAYLLSVSVVSSAPAVPVILLSTPGQMSAKLLLYLAGRGLVKLPLGRPASLSLHHEGGRGAQRPQLSAGAWRAL